VNIDKDQIIALLKQQQHPQADQAQTELPNQIDTDNTDHQNLLGKYGINPADLISKFGGGGLGKL
jgi:hypothetical protein